LVQGVDAGHGGSQQEQREERDAQDDSELLRNP
jgi:hypothetical protein